MITIFQQSDKVYALGGGVTIRKMHKDVTKPFVVLNRAGIIRGFYTSLQAALDSQSY